MTYSYRQELSRFITFENYTLSRDKISYFFYEKKTFTIQLEGNNFISLSWESEEEAKTMFMKFSDYMNSFVLQFKKEGT